ncbi:unnamed protein product [Prunus armeniaca]
MMMGSSAPTGACLAAKSAPLSGPSTRAGQPQNSSTAANLQIQSYATATGAPPLKTIPSSRPKASTDGSGCTHCGNPKHTRDTYFKLNGYPDWWEEVDPTDNPTLPDVSSNCDYVFHTSDLRDITSWIIDSGATDTFDPIDFLHTTTPHCTSIANANRVTYLVKGDDTVALSPCLSLSNTDILTKEIIGRGTKRGVLYYVDDFSMGRANSVKH